MGFWLGGLVFGGLLACGGGKDNKKSDEEPKSEERNAPGDERKSDEGVRGGDKKKKEVKKDPRHDAPPEPPFQGQADPCAVWEHPGTFTFTTTFNGKEETTLVNVPAKAGPRKMVFVLHGGDGNGLQIIKQSGILPIAESENLVVVAPSGAWLEDRQAWKWNSGKRSHADMRDDVAFLDALVTEVGQQTCSTGALVFGFSNGGQMANRWACQGTKLDAMLTSTGTLLVDPETCNGRKVPVLGYIGTEDRNFSSAPTDGGMSAPDTVNKFWAKNNGCSEETKSVVHGDTTCHEFQGCTAPTTLCVIDGFPHAIARGRDGKKPSDADTPAEGIQWFKKMMNH